MNESCSGNVRSKEPMTDERWDEIQGAFGPRPTFGELIEEIRRLRTEQLKLLPETMDRYAAVVDDRNKKIEKLEAEVERLKFIEKDHKATVETLRKSQAYSRTPG